MKSPSTSMTFDHKILIIKHGAFGDLIQGQGAIQDIRLAYPASQLTLLTSPVFASMMQRCPYLDHVLIDARRPFWQLRQLWHIYKQLRTPNFDVVIDLQNSSRTNAYRQYILNHSKWIGRLPNEPKPVSGLKGLKTLFEKNKIPTKNLLAPDLSWLVDEVDSVLETVGVSGQYCVLVPGASAAHPEKRWPYYPELAQLLNRAGQQVVTVLGPDEMQLAKDFSTPVISGLSWFQLAGLIQRARFVVGNDTGPCHLASVIRKPGLALFGPTTSAARSELARGLFETVETSNLGALCANDIYAILKDRLATTWRITASH